MKKKILRLLSILPIFSLISCAPGNDSLANRYEIDFSKVKKDPSYKANPLNKYFQETYLSNGNFVGDISIPFKEAMNDSTNDFNQKPSSNIDGFSDDFNDDWVKYAKRGTRLIPTESDLQNPAALFDIDSKYLKNIVNFVANYYQQKNSDILGYNFYKGISNNNKVVIRAMGGPSNKVNNYAGAAIYFKLGSDYDVIALNDSQFSFDPIKLDKEINKTANSIGYLDAFKNLFKIKDSIDNATMISLIDFALSYIDTQRIEQLQEQLKNNNKQSYLYGFSQGYIILQKAMLINVDVLSNATKVRTDNNTLRPIVGLFRKNDPNNYNIRQAGGVLTATSEKVAIAGNTRGVDPLFAFSKRLLNLTENLMTIYQNKFNNNNNFKNAYQKKVRISFSKRDWNVGDLTPKELNFFTKNKVEIKVSPEDGHGMNFPIKEYVDWITT